MPPIFSPNPGDSGIPFSKIQLRIPPSWLDRIDRLKTRVTMTDLYPYNARMPMYATQAQRTALWRLVLDTGLAVLEERYQLGDK
jgi:hypothetical protein